MTMAITMIMAAGTLFATMDVTSSELKRTRFTTTSRRTPKALTEIDLIEATYGP